MFKKIRAFVLSHNGPSFAKRLPVTVFAVVLLSFGITCYYQCGLGADPYSSLVDSEHFLMGLTVGQVTYINNLILFIFMLIFGRKYIHVGTVIFSFCTGAFIDLFAGLLHTYLPATALWMQIVYLLVGLVSFSVAIALYVIADLGINGIECMALVFSKATHINLRWVRVGEDVVFVLLAVVIGLFAKEKILGGIIGFGTLAGALGTGPIMKLVINFAMEPMQRWFGPLRKTPVSES